MYQRISHRMFLACVGCMTLALLAIGSLRPVSALPPICWDDPHFGRICVPNPAPGIVGGGVVETSAGEVQLSLFASRVVIEGLTEVETTTGEEPVTGAIMWFDPSWEGTGLMLESTVIEFYAPIPGSEGVREIRGFMTANGEGEYPFVLNATDAGPPGSGQDRVTLSVGNRAEGAAAAASDFGYASSGQIVGGDLQIVSPDDTSTSSV